LKSMLIVPWEGNSDFFESWDSEVSIVHLNMGILGGY
jgi:hypothetical protein